MTPREEVALLKEQAELRAQISNSLEGYIDGLKRAKAVDVEINRLRKIEGDVQAKINAARAAGNAAEEAKQQRILDILKSQTDVLEEQNNILKDNLKTVNKTNLLMAKGAASMVKTVANLPNLIEKGYGKIKGLGLFEMDKAIKKSALSMGLMTSDSKQFRSDIKMAADDTLIMGVGIEELAKYQSDYSEALGRTVMLNKEGLKAMADMAAATALGAEGAASLAADFEQQGLSAERTRDFVEQTMNDSHKMGLNASKVIKNMQQNFKLLNKYNFKGGIKGLEKMAETTTRLGIDMNSVTGMADKLFDIEGAVDMSAQLQVMGGEWAKMSDPFHLMYMARNDMEGLTEEIGKAAQSSVHFNDKTKEFEISAMEMHRLRKIAEQTGVDYETLATAGKNAAKFTKIRGQISFNADKDTKEFLTNTAKFDEQGRAYIEMDIDGKKTKKFLSELDGSNMTQLNAMIKQKKTLEQYAKDSRTFDEALTNFINQLKVKLLPFVEALNDKLMPRLDGWIDTLKKGKWLDKLESWAKTISGWITTIGGWMMDHPWQTAIIGGFAIGAAKFGGFLWDLGKWFANGISMGEGFNLATGGAGGGAGGGGLLGKMGGLFNKFGGSVVKIGGYIALAANAASLIYSATKNIKKEGFGEGLKHTLKDNAFKILGGVAGAMIGGPVGAGIGASIGSMFDSDTKVANDAVFTKPLNDGGIPAGFPPKQFDKKTAIIKNNTITPINNKDDLLTMKPDGPVAKKLGTADNSPNVVKHEFGDLRINGELKITTPGNSNTSVDLLKSPEFIRSITHMIQVEMQRGKNQVQKA
jgi:hypothetical protein